MAQKRPPKHGPHSKDGGGVTALDLLFLDLMLQHSNEEKGLIGKCNNISLDGCGAKSYMYVIYHKICVEKLTTNGEQNGFADIAKI